MNDRIYQKYERGGLSHRDTPMMQSPLALKSVQPSINTSRKTKITEIKVSYTIKGKLQIELRFRFYDN